ncbi:GrpB family protein [Paenibacillus sacheonensis]|uniref:GrpB family protein n=1 Tax=Paenibacillus sacheonensis TaxID=742054 RepID=A0A7X4YQW8_9BACL|nr:GrpB family protein [Paenibacillus sacheonensis]MBM7567201.1 GrpB-like predicted nucleotidyltransferase (UPF0157 family) [Paenibacillus sacheonensis]NBC70873.1 GrpB family protein [Paenibacillus sacheonensis]
MGGEVVVLAYDPEWARQFELLKAYVQPALSDLAVGIEHVGSTSVPGLAAKPIVDIDVTLAAPADVRTAVGRLAELGYVHEGDLGMAGREAFIPPAGLPWHHLYAYAADHPEYRRHLLFRDYLRSHPEEVQAYGELKRRLVERFRHNRAAYSEAKGEFVSERLRRAGWEG